MNLPLRRRHRRIFAVLAVLLPVIYAVGTRIAPRATVNPVLPAASARSIAALSHVAATLTVRNPPLALDVRAGAAGTPADAPVLEITPCEDPRLPDLHLYWASDVAAAGQRLPAGARWLGRLVPTGTQRFRLPVVSARERTRIFVYSPPHAAVEASFELPALAAPR